MLVCWFLVLNITYFTVVFGNTCRRLPSEGHSWCFFGKDKGDKYFYDYKTKQCAKFYYYGCGGNDNRFNSKQSCNKKCNPRPKNDCNWPPDKGKKCGLRGRLPGARVYYDKKDKTCRRFKYLGCGGNKNNFESYLQCENKCGKIKNIKKRIKAAACHLPKKKGSSKLCPKESSERYYFDVTKLKCKRFEYSGCNGNANNFRYKSHCEKACGIVKPSKKSMKQRLIESQRRVCKLRRKRGEYCVNKFGDTLKRSVQSFAWNDGLKKCEMFYYKGCKGNKNRFKKPAECFQFGRQFCLGV